MGKIKHICVIADGYPSEYLVKNAFVETLVNAMTDSGVNCTVIAMQSLSRVALGKEKKLPDCRVRHTPQGNRVTVWTAHYLSASNKKIGSLRTAAFGLHSAQSSVERIFKKLLQTETFDAIYGHFINPAGMIANYLGRKYHIPAFFAYGESSTHTIDCLGDEKTRELLHGITGVVSVSTENKRVLIEKNMVSPERIGVFPNSVDTGCFYPRDRAAMRRELGFPPDGFIVAFVGRFLDVKGPDRLSAAIEQLNDDNIYSIFIGDGPLKPACRNMLHCGPLQHEEIPKYLSAADIFVLPTKAEGCCNAIIEAMACGLPVISSDLPFNDDILKPDRSILLDPTNVDEIADAVRKLKEDSALRAEKADAAIRSAQFLSIEQRAKDILEFLYRQATE
ncbi:MAG: glycosyltransferase [Eubacteriales bacterium]|nr:glycosyltransferase [Eubacteriales bacterium]